MTKEERVQFNHIWLEVENVITLIEPNLPPEEYFERPEKCGPKELNFLLQFLRLQVKMLLHDKESTVRENISLTNLVGRNNI